MGDQSIVLSAPLLLSNPCLVAPKVFALNPILTISIHNTLCKVLLYSNSCIILLPCSELKANIVDKAEKQKLEAPLFSLSNFNQFLLLQQVQSFEMISVSTCINATSTLLLHCIKTLNNCKCTKAEMIMLCRTEPNVTSSAFWSAL